jgi:hypothetical protein
MKNFILLLALIAIGSFTFNKGPIEREEKVVISKCVGSPLDGYPCTQVATK